MNRNAWTTILVVVVAAVATPFVATFAQRAILGQTYLGATLGATLAVCLVVGQLSIAKGRQRRSETAER